MVGLFRIYPDGRFWWSPGMYHLFGFDPADGPPSSSAVFARYHPDDRNVIGAFMKRGLSGSLSAEARYRIRRPDGTERQIWSRSRSEIDDDGLPCMAGIEVDITDIMTPDADLLASERRHRFASDNARDVIIRYELNGVVSFASRAAKTLLGYAPEALAGMSTLDLVHPEDQPTVLAAFGQLSEASDRSTAPIEYRTRHADGRWIWCESRPRLVRDAAGEPLDWVDVIRDITDRKATDEALAAARLQADAAARAKTEFLANMSHELRTPLTSIIGFSRLVADDPGMSDVSRRHLALVRSASDALLTVVNDILDLSKLEAGAVELLPADFSVRHLVMDVVDLLREQASAKGLTLTAQADATHLIGDSARLRQVLLNLVGNAVKFTGSGSVEVRAECLAGDRSDRTRLRIEVSDTGIGIPPDRLEEIFDRFSQADGSISRRFGGTGLGLSISRRLVELMGGVIGVDSDGRSGSRFWFEVDMPTAATVDTQADVPRDLAAPDRPLRILLAEDSPANRTLVGALLAAYDIELVPVEDGACAVQAAMEGGFDLILMDMHMPVMDGPAATRRIRSLGGPEAEVPIVALTANVLPEQIALCLDAGMQGHVGKPISPDDLFEAIALHARSPAGSEVSA